MERLPSAKVPHSKLRLKDCILAVPVYLIGLLKSQNRNPGRDADGVLRG
jgi:hypothetical protein